MIYKKNLHKILPQLKIVPRDGLLNIIQGSVVCSQKFKKDLQDTLGSSYQYVEDIQYLGYRHEICAIRILCDTQNREDLGTHLKEIYSKLSSWITQEKDIFHNCRLNYVSNIIDISPEYRDQGRICYGKEIAVNYCEKMYQNVPKERYYIVGDNAQTGGNDSTMMKDPNTQCFHVGKLAPAYSHIKQKYKGVTLQRGTGITHILKDLLAKLSENRKKSQLGSEKNVKEWVLLADIDGTLTSDNYQLAEILPENKYYLQELLKYPNLHLCLVTGRDAHTFEELSDFFQDPNTPLNMDVFVLNGLCHFPKSTLKKYDSTRDFTPITQKSINKSVIHEKLK